MNDGLAFPFVHLAILLATVDATGNAGLLNWLTIDVGWRLAAGVAVGVAVGRGLGWLTFRMPNRARLSRTGDGFVALGITTVAYSVAEMMQGYGFLAVFVAAVAFRATERRHRYHEKLHDFVEQIERLLMMILLVLFGGALAVGGLLRDLRRPRELLSPSSEFAGSARCITLPMRLVARQWKMPTCYGPRHRWSYSSRSACTG